MCPKTPLMEEKLFDHGFVELLDVMGSDEDIVNTARTSYDKGTKQTSTTEGLIRYLMRHQHNGPFEFGEFTFRIRCPFFVARQWFRHRTGSYNEVSLRYSEAPDEFYVPKPEWITTQDSRNKQARTTTKVSTADEIVDQLKKDAELLLNHYQDYLHKGTAREIARINLPLSLYTTFMFKIDLRNLLNFLYLRFDSHAQFEIRQYAIAILKMVEKYFPITVKSWKDYVKESITFSKSEIDILQELLKSQPDFLKRVEEKITTSPPTPLSVGEKAEFLDKIRRLLGLPESHNFLE
jgi:thymidylate synthase (FAD)